MQRHSKKLSALSSDPPPPSLPQESITTPSPLWALSSDEFNEGMTHTATLRQSARFKSKQNQMGQLKMRDFSKRVNTSSNSNCSDPELRQILKALYPSDPPPDQTNDGSNRGNPVAPVPSKGPGRMAMKKQTQAGKGKSMRSYSKQQKILSNSTTSDYEEVAPQSLDCPAKRTRRNVPSGDAHALSYDNLMAGEVSGEHTTVMNGNIVNPHIQLNDPYEHVIHTRSMGNAVNIQQQQQPQYFVPLQPAVSQQHQGQWIPMGGYDTRGNCRIAEDFSLTGGSAMGSVGTSRSRESSQITEGSVTRGTNGRMPYPKNRKRTTEAQRNDPVWRENNEKANESVRKWRNKKKLEDEAKDMFLMDAIRLLGEVRARKILPSNPTEVQQRTFKKFYDDVFPR